MTVKAALNQRETLFLAALFEHPSIKSAAKACGISESQAHRMLDNDVFMREYRRQSRQYVKQALGQLQAARGAAIATLRQLMDDASVSPSVRAQAARALVDLADKSIEVMDFDERLETIERQLDLQRPVGARAGIHAVSGVRGSSETGA